MKYLNEKQLDMRIESFLVRKNQQYPELSLRGTEKQAESIGHVVIDKLFEIMNRRRVAHTFAAKKLNSSFIHYTKPKSYILHNLQ